MHWSLVLAWQLSWCCVHITVHMVVNDKMHGQDLIFHVISKQWFNTDDSWFEELGHLKNYDRWWLSLLLFLWFLSSPSFYFIFIYLFLFYSFYFHRFYFNFIHNNKALQCSTGTVVYLWHYCNVYCFITANNKTC